MYHFEVYKTSGFAEIYPLSTKREWMDNTWEAHAYKCFPVTVTNSMGWGISFPEDIVFTWDGISDSNSDHVKVISGEKYVSTGRANGTISFNTGLVIRSGEDVSLLHMPVPNYWRDGVQAFTTIISPSVLKGYFPCAWRITRPNTEIVIKAGTPVIAVVPIELKNLHNSELVVNDISSLNQDFFLGKEYSDAIWDLNRQGKWSNFYRNATDHLGNSIGKHEIKSIKMKVLDHVKNVIK